jgi:hypothetical protein
VGHHLRMDFTCDKAAIPIKYASSFCLG